ncbi:ABC transporter permease subunit [Pyrococcus kukulkanii]|uniref:ABC transporter permease subunit n=1 Tax=Pyrococcus kukulkanii TaxID=1609559 RepID=UPI00356A895B
MAIKVIVKNITVAIIVSLLVGTLISYTQLRFEYFVVKRFWERTPKEEIEELTKHGFKIEKPTPPTLPRILNRTKKYILNIKDLFEERFFEKWLKVSPIGALLTTLLVLSLSMILIFIGGLILGTLAGFKGGTLDKLVLNLAPIFSAIPGWFWGVLFLWLLWWRLDLFTIDFQRHVLTVQAKGESMVLGYLKASAIPVLTLFFTNVLPYAFIVRNIVRKERINYFITVDRLKGFPESRIIRKMLRLTLPEFLIHTLNNLMILLSVEIAIEKVFTIPGIGYVFMNAVGIIPVMTDEGIRTTIIFNPPLVYYSALGIIAIYTIFNTAIELMINFLEPRRG